MIKVLEKASQRCPGKGLLIRLMPEPDTIIRSGLDTDNMNGEAAPVITVIARSRSAIYSVRPAVMGGQPFSFNKLLQYTRLIL